MGTKGLKKFHCITTLEEEKGALDDFYSLGFRSMGVFLLNAFLGLHQKITCMSERMPIE